MAELAKNRLAAIERRLSRVGNWDTLFRVTAHGVRFEPTGEIMSHSQFAALKARLQPRRDPVDLISPQKKARLRGLARGDE